MLYSLSIYLARLTLGSIGVTNKGATTIMAWLNKIAAIADVSPVFQPAYESTSVSKRAKDKVEELEKEKINKINNKLDSMMNEIEELSKLD